MTSRDFCYWLQGFFEVREAGQQVQNVDLTAEQVICVRNHLNMVFKHEIDPSHGDTAHQAVLSQAHQGGGVLSSSPKFPPEGLLGGLDTLADPDSMPKLNC